MIKKDKVIKNIVIIFFSVVVIFFFITIAVNRLNHTASSFHLVDYDIYHQGSDVFIFTIEGRGNRVYSKTLEIFLNAGHNVNVYALERTKFNTREWTLLKTLMLNERKDVEELIPLLSKMDKVYQTDMEVANPWTICAGQMNDNLQIELFVGAFRATRYYPADTRPYFLTYDYNENKIFRLWTGTYLSSHAFKEPRFVSVDKEEYDVLKVTERTVSVKGFKDEVNYYTLKGFSPYKLVDINE